MTSLKNQKENIVLYETLLQSMAPHDTDLDTTIGKVIFALLPSVSIPHSLLGSSCGAGPDWSQSMGTVIYPCLLC